MTQIKEKRCSLYADRYNYDCLMRSFVNLLFLLC